MIALVITIIVLLILAGVTIAMLTGENGILNQANNAKETTDEATAKEKIQVEVAGSYGTDGKIDIENLLNTNLKNISGLIYKNSALSDTNKIDELPVEVSLDGYTFTIEENGNVLNMTNANAINSKIGTVVDGYSAQNLQWQVFYADANETFLISKTLAKTNWTIPLRGENKTSDYDGSADVRKSAYGTKWNKKWLAKCTEDTANNGESTRNNAKATAYLCDSDNWVDYATGPANYAVGGPTIELLIASWNKSQNTNVELLDSDVTAAGSAGNKPSELGTSYPVTSIWRNIRNGTYNSGEHYYLSSPGYGGVLMVCSHGYTRVYDSDIKDRVGARLLVSIPTSKISVSGDTVTVLP